MSLYYRLQRAMLRSVVTTMPCPNCADFGKPELQGLRVHIRTDKLCASREHSITCCACGCAGPRRLTIPSAIKAWNRMVKYYECRELRRKEKNDGYSNDS